MNTYKPKKNTYQFNKFIGTKKEEEYYFKNITFDCGWYWGGIYIEGLRPATEEELRESQRDRDISDYYTIPEGLKNYIDEEKWADDMEEDWYDSNDIQREEERDGQTTYLCFGSHNHADTELMNKSWQDFTQEYETELTQTQYTELQALIKQFYQLKKECDETHQTRPDKYLKKMEEMEEWLQTMENWNENKLTQKEKEKIRMIATLEAL